jgi:organic radical activating enzyme|tara:strand:+ start:22 stop:1350 length:1329 start_codon:yes stop_codon:yes gene_type:complete
MHNKQKKTLSCEALHHSVYLAPNELRHCCKRFFVNGEKKGDVKIFPVKSEKDITEKSILDAKKKLYEKINNGEKNPCTGCPYLYRDHWPEFNKLSIKQLSIENTSVCSMKCSYCSDMYYGGLKSNYDLGKVFKKLENSQIFSDEINISWGGGEPLLIENFEKNFEEITSKIDPKKPIKNMVYSNAIKHSKVLENFLKKGLATLTTSIDAGTEEVFKKIRGVKGMMKVFENLKKYNDAAKKGIIIKYIFTNENYYKNEVQKFIENCENYNLLNCSFQISSNFEDENITSEVVEAAFEMYFKLKSKGVNYIFFDYHLRPRINEIIWTKSKENDNNFIKNHLQNSNLDITKDTNIVLWGAGETARRIIKNNYFFKLPNVKIHYFVDEDTKKIGKKLNGISVKHPESLKDNNFRIVISTSIFYEEIINKMKNLNISETRLINDLVF